MYEALSKGYTVDKIYEVWHFEVTSNALFKGFVLKFLKINMESSTLINKSIYEFWSLVQECLRIEPVRVIYNPSMSAIAKDCGGSFDKEKNMKQTIDQNIVTP